MFQHTAARRRLVGYKLLTGLGQKVSTHSRPKAAGFDKFNGIPLPFVSTHSRPKAAGLSRLIFPTFLMRFNTQPPEGGWESERVDFTVNGGFQHTAARRRLVHESLFLVYCDLFQHTAARRRLGLKKVSDSPLGLVSTHSRPKAAGNGSPASLVRATLFQHTAARRRLAGVSVCSGSFLPFQHTAARRRLEVHNDYIFMARRFQHTAARRRLGLWQAVFYCVSRFQHTAARRRLALGGDLTGLPQCFNTQPPEGGWDVAIAAGEIGKQFQHTAARRRLGQQGRIIVFSGFVSTHSRPKAAGEDEWQSLLYGWGFNTQPPEGGWAQTAAPSEAIKGFQHTAARRRLGRHGYFGSVGSSFNTQPPEGGWANQNTPENIKIMVSTHSRPKAAGPQTGQSVQTLRSFNTQPPEGGWGPSQIWQKK